MQSKGNARAGQLMVTLDRSFARENGVAKGSDLVAFLDESGNLVLVPVERAADYEAGRRAAIAPGAR